MQSLRILIHQARSFHQIPLHQAFNAQGVFNVQLSDDWVRTTAFLDRSPVVDILVLDHDMPWSYARSLFQYMRGCAAPRALLFVGQGKDKNRDLAQDARTQGFRVVGELPWPISTVALQRALAQL
jgi:hypothetical protein